MINSAELITKMFTPEILSGTKDDVYIKISFRDWVKAVFDRRDETLVRDLVAQPYAPGTQKKLKEVIAKLTEEGPMLEEMLAKLVPVSKTLPGQAVNNSNAAIENQINIQHHTGDIHIHYDTKEEEKADHAVALFDIKMLVASGDTKQAIEKLLQESKQNYKRLLNDSILVAGRFNGLNKQIDTGVVSNENARIEMAKINQAILHYVEQMEMQKNN